MKNYFVIHSDEDGEVTISNFTEEELLKELEENTWETKGFITTISDTYQDLQNLDSDKLLIIKGEIVKPKPKNIVKSYEL